jgi:hypothetical protein
MSRQVKIFAEWLFWSVLALILWMQTGAFSEEIAEYKFGADGWPKMVIGGIVIGATGQALLKWLDSGARSDPEEAPQQAPNSEAKLPVSWRKRGQQLAIFGMPLLYLWAMHRIGFFVASPLFIAAYLYVLEVRNWRHILGVTFIILALLFYVFVRLFYVAVPVGAWESFYAINNEIITYIRLGL